MKKPVAIALMVTLLAIIVACIVLVIVFADKTLVLFACLFVVAISIDAVNRLRAYIKSLKTERKADSQPETTSLEAEINVAQEEKEN